MSPIPTVYPIFPLQALAISSSRLLLINHVLIARNVVFHTLHLVFELPDLLLHLRLEAVRCAFARCGFLSVDDEERAALGWAAAVMVVVAFRVGNSSPAEAGLSAEGEEGGWLELAAAFEGEGVVETHG